MNLAPEELAAMLRWVQGFFRCHAVPRICSADDLRQDTCLRVLRAREVVGQERRRAFVFAVALRVWKESVRRAERQRREGPGDLSAAWEGCCQRRGHSVPEAQWLRARIDLQERALPVFGTDTELFLMLRWDGHTLREARSRLGLSPRAAQSARRRISRLLSTSKVVRSLLGESQESVS